MSTKITKAEFETLPDTLKPKFKAEGDAYVLQEEDVDGLKKSKAEILEEKKRIQAERDELAKFKLDHEQKEADADEEKLKAAGEFKQLEQKLRDKITEVEAGAAEKESKFLASLKRERLQNFLTEKGVLADRADLALADVVDRFDLISEEGKFSLKLKDGIGGAAEMDEAIGKLKETRPFLFSANGASGSGASGSQGNGGGQSKVMARDAFAQMPAADQMAFSKSGGTLTD